MEDPILKKPPPHLEGILRIQETGKFGKKIWKSRHLKVVRDALFIFENNREKETTKEFNPLAPLKDYKQIRTIPLNQVHITEVIASQVPKEFSVNWSFQIEFDDEKVTCLTNSFDNQRYWVDGLQYVKKFWAGKVLADQIKDMKGHQQFTNMENGYTINKETFTVKVIAYNQKTHVVTLDKTAKFSNLFRSINGDGPCANCAMCLLREKAAQLWALDNKGNDFMIRKLEKIQPYAEQGCQLYLLEHGYKLLVVQFPDSSFMAVPVEPSITATEVAKIDSFANKLAVIGCTNVGLFLRQLDGQDLPFGDEEKPISIFYEMRHGAWRRKVDVKGYLVFRNKSLKFPSTNYDDDDDNLINSGKSRAAKIISDSAQTDIRKELDLRRKKNASRPENQMEFLDNYFETNTTNSSQNLSKTCPSSENPFFFDPDTESGHERSKSAPDKMDIKSEPKDLNPVYLSSSLSNRCKSLNPDNNRYPEPEGPDYSVINIAREKSPIRGMFASLIKAHADPESRDDKIDVKVDGSTRDSDQLSLDVIDNNKVSNKARVDSFKTTQVRNVLVHLKQKRTPCGSEDNTCSPDIDASKKSSDADKTTVAEQHDLEQMTSSEIEAADETVLEMSIDRSQIFSREGEKEQGSNSSCEDVKNETSEKNLVFVDTDLPCEGNNYRNSSNIEVDGLSQKPQLDSFNDEKIPILFNQEVETITSVHDFQEVEKQEVAKSCDLSTENDPVQYAEHSFHRNNEVKPQYTKQDNIEVKLAIKTDGQGSDDLQSESCNLITENSLDGSKEDRKSHDSGTSQEQEIANKMDRSYSSETKLNQVGRTSLDSVTDQLNEYLDGDIEGAMGDTDRNDTTKVNIDDIDATTGHVGRSVTLKYCSKAISDSKDTDNKSSMDNIGGDYNEELLGYLDAESNDNDNDNNITSSQIDIRIQKPHNDYDEDSSAVLPIESDGISSMATLSPDLNRDGNSDGDSDEGEAMSIESFMDSIEEDSKKNDAKNQNKRDVNHSTVDGADSVSQNEDSFSKPEGVCKIAGMSPRLQSRTMETRQTSSAPIKSSNISPARDIDQSKHSADDAMQGILTEDSLASQDNDADEKPKTPRKKRRKAFRESSIVKEVRQETLRLRRQQREIEENKNERSSLENGKENLQQDQAAVSKTDVEDSASFQESVDTNMMKIEVKSGKLGRRDTSNCTTCLNCAEKPFPVSTYKSIKLVLEQSSKPHGPAEEVKGDNKFDYICLSGVHLRNVKGLWELVDGTEFHEDTETTDKSEEVKGFTHSANRNSIATKVIKEKQLTLSGGICCHWIPKQHGNRGKWRVTKCKEQEVVAKQFDEYEQDLTPRPISTPVFGNSGNNEASVDVLRKVDVPRKDRSFSSTLNNFTDKVGSKVKDALSRVSSLPSSNPSSRASSPTPVNVYMSLELITIREKLLVPLNRAVNQIRQHFNGATSDRQLQQLADDSTTPCIGFIIRRQLCSALSALLLYGLKSGSLLPNFLFGKPMQYNTWNLVKEVALLCRNEPILLEMIKVIQKSPFLFDDELRFRCFVSETLNYPNETGEEKLLMTWYKNFLSSGLVLEKFYKIGSLWRLQRNVDVCLLIEESLMMLGHLNEYPFNLRADFEYNEIMKNMKDKNSPGNFKLQREPKEVDMEVFLFE